MSFPPYPLAWPDGLPRTEKKAASQFRTSLSAAINNVKKSLTAFAADTGRSVSEVATELFLSVKTISTYRTRVLEKMGMHSNADLTYYGIKNGIIQ